MNAPHRTRARLETRHRLRPRTEETLIIPGIFRPPSVQVEVRKFNLYGNLRKSNTEIHNTLPSPELIEREIRYIAFEDERRNKAQQVEYKDFYRFLTPTLKHRPARDISNSKPVKSATVNDAISP
ncbi:uncharacterized protein LOC125678976 isoform X2 [Ostrea edulis]|uniref:uncharacterized protein LOC125678976 isoform X2 n=1 Tax=Ostrea edulis TaxID=37623 RepID=UPI002095A5C1|nr:uncharacterized protein LOC125678976 isoform X2 [Ostrea edulis]